MAVSQLPGFGSVTGFGGAWIYAFLVVRWFWFSAGVGAFRWWWVDACGDGRRCEMRGAHFLCDVFSYLDLGLWVS